MESFFRTHRYLVEHLDGVIPRLLMKQIDWSHRLIGIKGTRGVGKTSFLLQYAKEFFDLDKRDCLYINLNQFYFTVRSITSFAKEFVDRGGKTLLLDQVYKYPDWSRELRECYDLFPQLKIVFTGSTVMKLGEDEELASVVSVYNLRGFSYREFLNILLNKDFRAYTLDEIIENHQKIAEDICSHIDPLEHFWSYMHHGYYPFFLEKRNFSENLLKTVNMMLEVDVLSIKQIEMSYLPKLRKLLYLLSLSSPGKPNISQLSIDCEISRATVTNYMEYLRSARLINMLYREDEEFPKKPELVYMHNTNLMFPLKMAPIEDQALRETFFYNQIHHSDCKLKKGTKAGTFIVLAGDKKFKFKIEGKKNRGKNKPEQFYAVGNMEIGEKNVIPLWLFGFLY
ncbi:putative AAA+ superfamily ATPase [Dysgonomonas sp. PFB1-18]|uniref:AAA family ATPase n=1 Tax=unclassified Dysgonomonas TaxID=2630389 RepID=UPI002475E841|nr:MULTISPECIES: AAA family ATPase [unclassified Dysgonomonas]MDH6307857.1 putative AAA+ superfamily ATPase [Dysgonomonas sp. PF1-14]MDH6337775.1 putative AAA+ superfamily ATPase [Dysgonomonas sp. PF1-16]MDH6378999.1 putative AAA+ superfamily ATPase [Dysgonomonas sp. PFB1-18]MDH6396634.1 putative AAA+ superfamily ATPase [Dysgonomonas sp. PF1-23]